MLPTVELGGEGANASTNFLREISVSKFIAAGGCMIYLFVIDTTLINEAAMWSIYTVMIW